MESTDLSWGTEPQTRARCSPAATNVARRQPTRALISSSDSREVSSRPCSPSYARPTAKPRSRRWRPARSIARTCTPRAGMGSPRAPSPSSVARQVRYLPPRRRPAATALAEAAAVGIGLRSAAALRGRATRRARRSAWRGRGRGRAHSRRLLLAMIVALVARGRLMGTA
jgi:hypothetical protein